jgi:hypothetical protein
MPCLYSESTHIESRSWIWQHFLFSPLLPTHTTGIMLDCISWSFYNFSWWRIASAVETVWLNNLSLEHEYVFVIESAFCWWGFRTEKDESANDANSSVVARAEVDVQTQWPVRVSALIWRYMRKRSRNIFEVRGSNRFDLCVRRWPCQFRIFLVLHVFLSTVSSDVTPYSPLKVSRRFGGTLFGGDGETSACFSTDSTSFCPRS